MASMPPRSPHGRVVLIMLVAGLFAGSVAPAFAEKSDEVSAGRARVAEAIRRLDKADAKADAVSDRLELASERLDAIIEKRDSTRSHLGGRAIAMYRTGDIGVLSVLLGAETFQEFATRWQMLTLMNRRDSEALARLEVLGAGAREATSELLQLQEESARAAAAAERELDAARRELAEDEAALRELQARTVARRAAKPAPKRQAQSSATTLKRVAARQPSGQGAWKVGVASHYGRNFTGRGASGAKIGPYSMICAHKTLPFGALVEFQYNGKRAVASVQDRGPFTPGRDFDLGPGIVRLLGFEGVHKVRYRVIAR